MKKLIALLCIVVIVGISFFVQQSKMRSALDRTSEIVNSNQFDFQSIRVGELGVSSGLVTHRGIKACNDSLKVEMVTEINFCFGTFSIKTCPQVGKTSIKEVLKLESLKGSYPKIEYGKNLLMSEKVFDKLNPCSKSKTVFVQKMNRDSSQ